MACAMRESSGPGKPPHVFSGALHKYCDSGATKASGTTICGASATITGFVMLTTHPFDDDKLREECGIFGIWGAETASAMVALGLHALQHRGQEAAGITSWDGHAFHTHRAMGHVAGNFDRDDVI